MSEAGASPAPGFRPQLDSLRAIAISTVLIHHYLNIRIGGLGVCLFFVLSGFLITGILLRTRDAAAATGSTWYGIRQFYVRRALRILPLYYFIIALTFALNLQPTRDALAWLLTYTFNVQVALQGWFPANLAHFWTLSVEEQFYLLWPWLILFAPRRWLPYTILGAITIGPLFRWIAFEAGWSGIAMFILTPASLDTLGIGALLALMMHDASRPAARVDRTMRTFLVIGLTAFVTLSALAYSGVAPQPNAIFVSTSLGLVCCWFVRKAHTGFHGVVGRVLDSRPLVYGGKITYGIYAYHLMMPTLFAWLLPLLGMNFRKDSAAGFLLASLASIGCAALSWHFLEQPINNLKRHVPYARTASRPEVVQPAAAAVPGPG